MNENKNVSDRIIDNDTGNPSITMRRGKTTFKIGISFNEKSKEVFDERITNYITGA